VSAAPARLREQARVEFDADGERAVEGGGGEVAVAAAHVEHGPPEGRGALK
jgi:hypothetical protein